MKKHRRTTLGASLALALLLVGCATRPAHRKSSPDAKVIEMEPVKIEAVRRGGGLEITSYDAAELFELGAAANSSSRFSEAETYYARVVSEFSESSLFAPALFNLGRVRFDQGKFDGAAKDFELFAARFPGEDARDANFLLGVCHGKLERWADSESVFEALLKRDDLSPDDRVEALSRRALSRLRQGDYSDAEQKFRLVFVYRDKLEASAEARLDTDYYLAFSQFHMGEIAHSQSTAILLHWPESQMGKDLEEKAKLLLTARRRYIEAVRYGNPNIASMAAYRIGALFQEFYDAVLSVPPPPELDGAARIEQQQIYFVELKKKLRVVLEKSLRGHEHNIELFERLGVESEWVKKSRDAIDKLRGVLDPEHVGLSDSESPASSPARTKPLGAEKVPSLNDDQGRGKLPTPEPLHDRQIL
ncbi:MAG: tetratricopeptide repeat protein [Deltaproteobacteria bacterium]|nr:tetratricopeptide repeat protein [Deltaproteobacteria bacterium]